MITRVLSLLLLLVSVIAEGSAVKPGEKVAAYSADGQPLLPLIEINDRQSLLLPDDSTLDLEGSTHDEAIMLIMDVLSETYPVSTVKIFQKNELMKVTVLGDLDEPGSYWLPETADLTSFNQYNNLFDADHFSASITLIRKGQRTVVQSKDYGQVDVQDGDILLLALNRRKIVPPPVVTKAVSVPDKVLADEMKIQAAESKKEGELFPREVEHSESPAEQVAEMEDKEEPVKAGSQAKKPNKPVKQKTADRMEKEALDKYSVVQLQKDYNLHPGDILIINLPGETGFNKDFMISRSGDISLPEVGQLKVTGQTLEQTEKLIYQKLCSFLITAANPTRQILGRPFNQVCQSREQAITR